MDLMFKDDVIIVDLWEDYKSQGVPLAFSIALRITQLRNLNVTSSGDQGNRQIQRSRL